MVYKEGKVPANARVDVSYTKGKPKINFSYPFKDSYKQALKEHSVGYHSIIIFLIIFSLFYVPYYYIGDSNYPSNCSVELNEGWSNISLKIEGYENKPVNISTNNYRSWVTGAEFICDTGNYSVYYSKINSLFSKSGFDRIGLRYSAGTSVLLVFTWLFAMFLTIYILNKLVTKQLLKSKRYKQWFPKAQARGVFFKTRVKKYRKFNSKDVLNNIIIIPRFSNVELDYKTKGDFSKYLTNVKIREYKKQEINIKSNKKSKIKSNNFKWYAVFYFSKKPKTGYLEVIFQ